MTKFPDLFAALAAPFHADDLRCREARDAKTGKSTMLRYITSRLAMNRLDDVLGPESWTVDYEPFGAAGGVKCTLSITLPDGSIVTKRAIGGTTPMRDPSDTEKTGESDSFKRVCVYLGIARSLYGDGQATFDSAPKAIATTNGHPSPVSTPEPVTPPRSLGWANGDASEPEWTGKRLAGWARSEEARTGKNVLAWLSTWGAKQGYPPKILSWNHSQAAAGHAAASRKLAASQEVSA